MHANNTCHFQTWSINICPCSLHALFPLSMLMQANTEILEAAGDLGSCKLKMAVKQNSGSSGFLTYCSEGATHWSGTPILGLQETGNKILLYLSCFINFGLFVFVTSVTLTNIAINWASERWILWRICIFNKHLRGVWEALLESKGNQSLMGLE